MFMILCISSATFSLFPGFCSLFAIYMYLEFSTYFESLGWCSELKLSEKICFTDFPVSISDFTLCFATGDVLIYSWFGQPKTDAAANIAPADENALFVAASLQASSYHEARRRQSYLFILLIGKISVFWFVLTSSHDPLCFYGLTKENVDWLAKLWIHDLLFWEPMVYLVFRTNNNFFK